MGVRTSCQKLCSDKDTEMKEWQYEGVGERTWVAKGLIYTGDFSETDGVLTKGKITPVDQRMTLGKVYLALTNKELNSSLANSQFVSYEGDLADWIPHGQGILTTNLDGKMVEYCGDFVSGQIRKGELIQNDVVMFKGEYDENFCANGQGKVVAPTHTKTGEFRKGVLWEGLITYKAETGLKEEVYREGQCVKRDIITKNGSKLTMEAEPGLRYFYPDYVINLPGYTREKIKGKYEYQSGSLMVGEWYGTAFTGEYQYVSGNVYKGVFTAGLLEGMGEMKDKDGNVYVGNFRNGKRWGEGTLRDSKGELKYAGQWVEDRPWSACFNP